MPYQRKKEGKVIEEQATEQASADDVQKNKLKQIADQNKQREAFESDRKTQTAATDAPGQAMATEAKKPSASR